MDPSFLEESLLLTLLISGVLLFAVTIVGLIAAVLQAATQIQDQTLSTVPKLLTICVTLLFFGNWMFEQLEELLFHSLQALGRIRS